MSCYDLQRSLRENGDVRLADSKLKDLTRLAETFGFHLTSLDVRQESTLHTEVCAHRFLYRGRDN